jgi:hypothetical protein
MGWGEHDEQGEHSELWQAIKRLERKMNEMSDASNAEQEVVTKLTVEVTTIAADVATVQTNLQAQINALAAGNPAVDFSALEAALAPLDGHVKALGELKPEAAPTPEPEPAPTPTPDPAPEPGPEPVPAEAALPPYTSSGDPNSINLTVWPKADILTIEGAALYNYVHDTPGGAATGDGIEGFTVWTGATEPIPAA